MVVLLITGAKVQASRGGLQMYNTTRFVSSYRRSPSVIIALSAIFAADSLARETRGASSAPIDPPAVVRPFAYDAVQGEGAAVRLVIRTGAFDDLKSGPEQRTLELPLGGSQTVQLEMQRFSVTRADTRFLMGGASGQVEMSAPDVVMFRGRVSGEPSTHAFIAFTGAGAVNGYVTLADGQRYYVSTGRPTVALPATPEGNGKTARATAPRVAAKDAGTVTVSRESAGGTWPENVPVCGTGEAHDLRIASPAAAARAVYGERGPRVLFVAVDTDLAFYGLFNNAAAAQAYIVQVVGAVSDIYMRDLDAELILTFSRLWPSGGEPFSAADLAGFANYWEVNENSNAYHLIHLMSGRRDLAYGGVAYVSGSCSGYSYAIGGFLLGSFPTPVDDPDLGNWDVVVVAHEMGHNMGTYHTHDGYTPPIDQCGSLGIWQRSEIMSYCHTTPGGMLNIEMRFSKRIQDVIHGDLEANNCQFFDCNHNGVNDLLDISQGTSLDTNLNQIPDECEDCNHNGVLDPAEIAAGATDINGNGVPDICEPDCNANGRPDSYDISNLGFADLNGNLVPDICEPNCNRNAVADFVEILNSGGALDLDRNGVPDLCQDCNANGVADWIDLLRPGNIFVADLSDYVREYHAASGVAVATHGSGTVLDPYDVAFGPDRMLYVASKGNNSIVKIDPDAGTAATFVAAGSGGLNGPSALTFGPDGNLYVSSLTTNSVLEFDGASGAFVRTFVSSGSGGLSAPYGLEFGPNGNLFVAGGNRVNEYDGASGAFVRNLVSPGSGGLSDPRGIAFTPDGRLLVVNRATSAILAYDAGGASLGQFNNDGYPNDQPWGIRIGPRGNVFVTRTASGPRVVEYDVNAGRYIRSFIRADAQMIQPTGLAFRSASPVDCNANGVLDVCDIASGLEQDCNSNLVPDSCESQPCSCVQAGPVIADSGGILKNRYLTFAPVGFEVSLKAIRVTFTHMPPPFQAFEGAQRWVGPPQDLFESPTTTFKGARLQCEPYYNLWDLGSAYALLEVYDDAIVPGAIYDVQAINDTCDRLSEANYSPPVTVVTVPRWGDIAEPFNPPATSTQPDFTDVSALVDKFKNTVGAPIMARADVYPSLPDQIVDFSDISAGVDAFKGLAYPFPGPTPCP